MSEITWNRHPGYEDIIYETCAEGIAKVTINRPEVHNAFRPRTVAEMIGAFDAARDDASVGVVVLTGAGPNAFCSGGDQRVRGTGGYVGQDGIPRLNVLDLQMRIRYLPTLRRARLQVPTWCCSSGNTVCPQSVSLHSDRMQSTSG